MSAAALGVAAPAPLSAGTLEETSAGEAQACRARLAVPVILTSRKGATGRYVAKSRTSSGAPGLRSCAPAAKSMTRP